ncbi:MAG TPA: hypothetical protein VGL38_01305 [bacterium]|jgi:outer membrane lipoprotein-sorting protein
MRNTLALFFAALTLGTVSFTSAADLPVALCEFEARCASRHSGVQDLTIVTDFIIHSPDGDVPSVHTIRQKGGKIRMDVSPQGESTNSTRPLEFVGISDDNMTWTLNRSGGKHQRQGSARNQQDPNFVCWLFTPENTKLGGEEMLRGRDCRVIDVQISSTTHRLWLDKEMQVVLQHEEVQQSGAVTRWEASNFHTVTGDLKIPQKTDMYIGDRLMATVLVQSVTFNTGLSDDLFDPGKMSLDPVAP